MAKKQGKARKTAKRAKGKVKTQPRKKTAKKQPKTDPPGPKPRFFKIKLFFHRRWPIKNLKYRCWCCDDDEEPHQGVPAIHAWLRDHKIRFRYTNFGFRIKHKKWSRFLCFFGKHEAYVMYSPDGKEPGSCTRCGKLSKHRDLWEGVAKKRTVKLK